MKMLYYMIIYRSPTVCSVMSMDLLCVEYASATLAGTIV